MYSNIPLFPGHLISKAYHFSLGHPHLLVHVIMKNVLILPQRISKVFTIPAFLKIQAPFSSEAQDK
jgi:hypothetical protein